MRWRRVRFQWEFEQEDEMLRSIARVNLSREVKDTHIWEGDISGEFSVKYAYECLTNRTRGIPNSIFKQLWQVKAFFNVLTTTWMVLLDKTCLLKKGGDD